ncbi:hypothetical protein FHG87_011399 [Trinorchestia longiramus]|nr:hypothetical protein FHG87_011399 [Trinorchestia longiramus]
MIPMANWSSTVAVAVAAWSPRPQTCHRFLNGNWTKTTNLPNQRVLGMRYLVGLDEECDMTVVDEVKKISVYEWNKRHLC